MLKRTHATSQPCPDITDGRLRVRRRLRWTGAALVSLVAVSTVAPISASAASAATGSSSTVMSPQVVAAPQAPSFVSPGSSRASALAFYQANHVPAPDSGWTGSTSSCTPGDTSQAYKDAIAQRINYFRQMAGVNTVSIDPTTSALAQKAALIMAAQGNISHDPPSNWACWTQAGHDAAGHSNLALGQTGPGAIDAYIQDAGPGNEFTGHRRTVLYANQTQFGSGDVPTGPTNALYSSIPGSTTRSTRDGYVAWPPSGYVPSDVIFQRWSLSYPGADFSNAAITMTKSDAAYSVTKLPITNGYGENTVVWAISELNDGGHLSPPASDTKYHVSITGVTAVAGATGVPPAFGYDVTAFDPGRPALDVTGQAFTPVSPHLGDHITLSATIKNSGTAPVPANVKIQVPFFDASATQVATGYLTQPLAVGASTTVQSSDTWTPTSTGTYLFYACADWTFQVVENPQCYPGATQITVASAASKPSAPQSVSATAGNGTATVTWSAPANDGGSTISGYTITASPGGASKPVSGAIRTVSFSGLTNGQAYTFTVTATNSSGTGPGAASNSVTPATTPSPPQSVQATAGAGSATVTWSAPASNGGSPLTQYVVVASPGPAFTTVSASTTSTTLSGLSPGTSYVFYVTAKNAVGAGAASDPSNSVIPTATATAPGAPTNVSATAGDAVATVTWGAPSSNGGSAITGYAVTRTPGNVTSNVGASATGATFTGLTNGTAYTFTVAAKNGIGTGPGATSAPVTPQAAPKPTTVQDAL